ncbi:MAG: type II secretion system protein [Candidatus Paceibacterota bacterium]|jgi:prepilin-type N-terminal cleavage/methylation domain-containing protein
MLKTTNYKLKTARGFTLVEVLVSSAIITVVMLVAIGAIITIQDASRKAQAVRAIIDNLHGAVENMSRKIRTGNTYYCGDATSNLPYFQTRPCDSSGFATAMSFMATDDVSTGEGVPTIYRMECSPALNGENIEPVSTTGMCREGQKGTIMYYKDNTNGRGFSGFEPLTDPKIDVKSLRFYVHNAEGVNGYPSVLITINGTIKIERININTPFNIETTISQYIK